MRAATCALLAGVALVLIVACGPGPTNDAPTPTGDISITVTVIGDGRATFAGLDFTCGATCTLGVDEGTDISLEAIPNAGRVLVAWDGPCSPFDDTCEWQAEAGTAVTVTFAPHALRFDLEGDGVGFFEIDAAGDTTECREACGVALQQPLAVTISYFNEGSSRTTLDPWDGTCSDATESDRYCLVSVEGITTIGKTWRHAPIASPQAYATPQETPRSVGAPGVLTGVDDTPGDRHTASVEIEPEHGTLTVAPSGSFTYEPNAGFAGLDTFTFRVTDAFGNTDDATATMTVHPRLTLEKQGAGTVTSEPSGIDCDVGCTSDAAIFDFDSSVTLTASPASSATFVGWSGDACDGSSIPTCDVPMNGPKNITATFSTSTYTLDVSRTGSGNVTSDPAGIDLSGGQGSAIFDHGTSITLTAQPAGIHVFAEWSTGPCAGSSTPTCAFTITDDTSVSATFIHRRVLGSAGSSAYGAAAWNPESIDRAGATPASRSSAPLTLRSRWSLTS